MTDKAKDGGTASPVAKTPASDAADRKQVQQGLWATLPTQVQQATVDAWNLAGHQSDPWTHLNQVYKPAPGHSNWFLQFQHRAPAGAAAAEATTSTVLRDRPVATDSYRLSVKETPIEGDPVELGGNRPGLRFEVLRLGGEPLS